MAVTVSINFRLPSELHAELVKEASAGGRSLNKEIIRRLSASLAGEDEPNAGWLTKVQGSPRISTEKRLLKLESEIDLLKEAVAALNAKTDSGV